MGGFRCVYEVGCWYESGVVDGCRRGDSEERIERAYKV